MSIKIIFCINVFIAELFEQGGHLSKEGSIILKSPHTSNRRLGYLIIRTKSMFLGRPTKSIFLTGKKKDIINTDGKF